MGNLGRGVEIEMETSKLKANEGNSSRLYLPGDLITLNGVDMTKCIQGRGIGRGNKTGSFKAHQRGRIERMNQMIMLSSAGGRYTPTVGDLVVSRVVDVNFTQAAWIVDVKGHRNASLPLASIVLPCGTQRRRNEQDQLAMRELFDVNDVIIAEVQRVGRENQSCSLHTRSAKYGKLQNGVAVSVPSYLIVRCDKHMSSIKLGEDETSRRKPRSDGKMMVDGSQVYVILGVNGLIWIGAPPESGEQDSLNYAEAAAEYNQVQMKLRTRICRVRLAIMILSTFRIPISWVTIELAIEASSGEYLNLTVAEMNNPENQESIIDHVTSKI